MKILIYGFGPYKNWSKNITKKIVNKLKKRKNLAKIIFPVKFEKKVFLDKIKLTNPDIILGLGQHVKNKKIKIERKAINLRSRDEREKPKIILKNNPKYLFTNLKFKPDHEFCLSYDAGKYVCNFSMYIIANFIKNKNTKFGFIHIPKDYNINKAIKFVESKIDEILKENNNL